jgi:DinB family protein
MKDIGRPEAGDYNDYFQRFVQKAPYQEALGGLRQQALECRRILGSMAEEDSSLRFGPGTWSRREILGHLVDVERLFSDWALRIARGQKGRLSGFDPDEFVRAGAHQDRLWAALIEDFVIARGASLRLFESLSSEAWSRRGEMGEGHHFRVRAIPFILQGHCAHHLEVIEGKHSRG